LFAQTVETTLARHGYTSVLCTRTLDGVDEDEYVSMLLRRDISAIVFVSGEHANEALGVTRYTALRERGLPIVLVNGYRPGVDALFVSNDDAAAVDLAVVHLVDLGHRRIGLAVGPERYVPTRRRVLAFRTAIRRLVNPEATDEDIEQDIAHAVYDTDGGAQATRALLERGVTAVVCASDMMAFGAIQEARRLGLRLPDQLSVVGSDGVDAGEHTWPALTTVRQPLSEMAHAVAQALVAELAGQAAPRAEVIFRPELVVRGSTAPPGSSIARPHVRSAEHR
jgi:DNA-binding LacI/PurR family transcriptional regulator